MKKLFLSLALFVFLIANVFSQEKKVKNVILLIPDGTSLSTVSAARWYQWYNHPDEPSLNIDPYLCGTVFTYCSDAPTGDSAPTTSCYVCGYPSHSGYVATYPPSNPGNDIFPTDSSKTYQPMMTAFEAAKLIQRKSTGLVVTCQFSDATPADLSSHSYNRDRYDWIVPQMVHNDVDVLIGGGTSLLNEEEKSYLKKGGYGLFFNDINNFRNYPGNKMWSLFGKMDMAYDLDRDSTQEPSLAEMSKVAIDKLSKNPEGFFLMIEGSKIDWGAHANDPVAMITDMIAFDKACGVALDFAKKNGETAVIVVPDHGNSGFSIGVERCTDYSHLTKDQLFKTVSEYQLTATGLIEKINETEISGVKDLFKKYENINLSDDQLKEITNCKDYKRSNLSDNERMRGYSLSRVVSKILTDNTCFGFTTHGHTAEEVFMANYDPTGSGLKGHISNIDISKYISRSLGLDTPLQTLSDEYFAKHTNVFNGYKYEVKKGKEAAQTSLTVKHKGKTLVVTPFTNIVKLNNKDIQLHTVIVYVDKNNTFYLPQSLRNLLD